MQFSTAYTQFSYQLLFQTCASVYEESGRIINVNKSDIIVGFNRPTTSKFSRLPQLEKSYRG